MGMREAHQIERRIVGWRHWCLEGLEVKVALSEWTLLLLKLERKLLVQNEASYENPYGS